MNSLKYLAFVFTLAVFMGCVPAEKAAKSEEKATGNKPVISYLAVKDGVITIQGNKLATISDLKIKGPSNTVTLKIEKKSEDQIQARVLSTLTLVYGTLYGLLISTAHGDDAAVPIYVEIPNGSLRPSVLSGTGVTPGALLKWNGTAWVPAPDLVGVGGNQLQFMGYTQKYRGNMGGAKGASEKCDAEYPGSHPATYQEILKLGIQYPYTESVWVEGSQTDFLYSGNPDMRLDNCAGWTLSSVNGITTNGIVMGIDGRTARLRCTEEYALACVK